MENPIENYWLILFGMACITFTCRYLFLSQKLPFELGRKAKSLLSFTAPSVLTAMAVPIVFLSFENKQTLVGESMISSFLSSPFLLAGGVCVFLSLKLQNTLLIVMLSMMVFFVLRFFL
ncbi:AzlD domain-containing protein [Psychromonas sp.]|nr:AzlD domain-containing protein [Psychromonas sp.]